MLTWLGVTDNLTADRDVVRKLAQRVARIFAADPAVLAVDKPIRIARPGGKPEQIKWK